MDGNLQISRDPATGDLLYDEPAPQLPAAPADPAAEHDINLALNMEQSTLDSLSDMLTENVTMDEESRTEWEDTQSEAMKLLGLKLDGEPDTQYEAADTSEHPLLLTALLRFQAKGLSALLPSDISAVNTKPVEDLDAITDPAVRTQTEDDLDTVGRRVGEFYAEYLFERLAAYEEDTDLILHDMGLIGAGLRKIVVDKTRRLTPVLPEYVNPADLIVSYNTRNFRQGRYAHRMDVATGDVIRRMRAGRYRPVKLYDHDQPDGNPIADVRDDVYGFSASGIHQTETHRLYEVYQDLYLKADRHPLGLPRPYITTIHGATREVLSVQRNWSPENIDETPLEHFIAYLYHPGRNAITGVGLGQILGNITKALRKAQRRSLEAAYLQNHASGFKLSNLTIRNGETKLNPGEFVDVDSPVNDIRAAIMSHTFQGPSPGLMALAEKMEANGRDLGGIASIDFASLMKSGVSVAPAMAAFEESTEFQTAVHRRLYKAHRKELKIIHDRMRACIGNEAMVFADGSKALQPGDLVRVDILPYMKPGQASRQKTVMEAQALMDTATANPTIVDQRKAVENFVRALNSPEGTGMIIPDPALEPPQPADPVTEYSRMLASQPVAAGMMQNHQAHIDAHAAQMKILETSQLPVDIGQRAMAAIGAHIAEHMGMQMIVEAATAAGMDPAQITPDMTPELEAQISVQLSQAIVALAAQKAPSEDDAKIQLETVKQQGALTREQLKAQQAKDLQTMKQGHEQAMADLKARQALELQTQKDDAAMDREIEDNTAALQIARSNATAKAAAGAGAGAGVEAKASAPA